MVDLFHPVVDEKEKINAYVAKGISEKDARDLIIENQQKVESSHNKWRALLDDKIQFMPVTGDHESMMKPPHVTQLAESIVSAIKTKKEHAQDRKSHAGLVRLQQGKRHRPPLICVPGSADTPVAFLSLIQELDNDIPVIATQYNGLDIHTVPHMSVEVAAESYIVALKKEYPQGPYRLLGHSFGGWIAYEMAIQLTRLGEQVDLLTIIDSQHPKLRTDRKTRVDQLMELAKIFTQSYPQKTEVSEALLSTLTEVEQLNTLIAMLPINMELQTMRSIVNAFIVNTRTLYDQEATFLNNALLINATAEKERDFTLEEISEAWANNLPNVTIMNLPANHMSLLKNPYVEKIGLALNKAMS